MKDSRASSSSARARRAAQAARTVVGKACLALLAAAWTAGLPIAAAAAQPSATIVSNSAQIAKLLEFRLPAGHVSHHPLDDDISEKTWDGFISGLDRERVYFQRADIERFEKHRDTLDDELKAGDVSFAYTVYEVWKDRVSNRCEHACAVLGKGFDLNREEFVERDRKASPWPENEEAWNEVWRKRLKNEYVQRLVAETLAAEEKQGGSTSTNTPPEQVMAKDYGEYWRMIANTEEQRILELFFSAFCRAYDPHCDYMSPAEMQDFDTSMKLSFAGIGAVLKSEDGMTKVERIIPGGPADRDKREKALRAGDMIIAVAQGDGEPVDVRHWQLYQVVRLIRGDIGTKVVLTVIPAPGAADGAEKRVDLIRDEIKLEDYGAKYSLSTFTNEAGVVRKFGTIRLPAFYSDMQGRKEAKLGYTSSSRDVARLLLNDARKDGVEGVILDLRNNGGGALTEAVQMSGLFFKQGPVVQVREGRRVGVLVDDDPAVVYSGPLVVLVNRLSASASEILAAALQDYGRAVIVGDSRTHGKGTVQTIMPLNEGTPGMGSVKLTTALFYRVTGSSTQLKGVISDVTIPSTLEFAELGEDKLPNSLEWTMIGGRPVQTCGNLKPVVAGLEEMALARRDKDHRFAAYTNLLQQLEMVRSADDVPLSFSNRLALAKTSKRLYDELRNVGDGTPGDGEAPVESKPPGDVVFQETLSVLDNLVSLTAPAAAAAVPDGGQCSVPAFLTRDDLPPELVEKVTALVEKLRSRDAAERSNAGKELQETLPNSIPVLKEYLRDEDPEVRVTIRALLEK